MTAATPAKRVFIVQDDVDRHDQPCACGHCNAAGQSFGAAIFDASCWNSATAPASDPEERIYAASPAAAVANARLTIAERGWNEVDPAKPTPTAAALEQSVRQLLRNRAAQQRLAHAGRSLVYHLDDGSITLVCAQGRQIHCLTQDLARTTLEAETLNDSTTPAEAEAYILFVASNSLNLHCPRCGAAVTDRHSRRDPTQYDPHWQCSTPDCPGPAADGTVSSCDLCYEPFAPPAWQATIPGIPHLCPHCAGQQYLPPN